MAIKDKEVDLTSNSVFDNPTWEVNKHYYSARNRLFNSTSDKTTFDVFLKDRKHEIPWCKREMELTNNNYRLRFKPDDDLSREMGQVMRMTSDNHFMILGDQESVFTHKEALEEFFIECIGYIPYEAYHRCWRCGNQVIAPTKEVVFVCDKCEEYTAKIPWKGRTLRR